jgi:hypothetical protein
MPVIRVTDATWERMKGHARPLEDTPDDIVQRALDALEGVQPRERSRQSTVGRPRKSHEGKKLPQREFRTPLLLTLGALGGAGSLADVRRLIYPRLEKRLGKADYGIVATGEPRWWNATCWERSQLVREGLLRSGSPRGVWELSERGSRQAKLLSQESNS